VCCQVDWRRGPGTTSPTHLALKLRAFCALPLVPSVISRGAPCQATWEVPVNEGKNRARNGWQIFHVNPGIFNMLQIYDMGQTALLPFRRKACWGIFTRKNPTASAGFEPANSGTRGQHVNRSRCVLSSRGLGNELITHPEGFYRLWGVVCDQETSWMRRPWSTGGCSTNNKTTTHPNDSPLCLRSPESLTLSNPIFLFCSFSSFSTNFSQQMAQVVLFLFMFFCFKTVG
jgi:hypothetical protein